MTWWSYTKCHIPTIMTEMNSDGHGLHSNKVNKIFTLCFKKLFHLKNRQVFMMHPSLYILDQGRETEYNPFKPKPNYKLYFTQYSTEHKICCNYFSLSCILATVLFTMF